MHLRLSRRLILPGALAIITALIAVPALADELASPGASEHVLIGLIPSAEFEVTCDDSIVHSEPVLSDALGIASFSVDLRNETPPNVFCVRRPGPPVITEERVIGLTDCEAVIRWSTDRPSTSRVEYGTSEELGQGTPLSTHLTTDHAVLIAGLTPETTYYVKVISVDAFGGFESESALVQFTTERPSLIIAGLSVADVTANSITMEWTTDRASTSWIEYGTDSSCGDATTVDQTLTTEHAHTIGGLSPNTLYYVRACSADDQSKMARSDPTEVTTELPPLGVFDVAVADTTSVTATIVWHTSHAATSTVRYGESEDCENESPTDAAFKTEHVVVLSGLSPATTYYCRTLSEDVYGQTTESSTVVFETTEDGQGANLALYVVRAEPDGPHAASVSWTTNLPSSSIVEYGLTQDYGLSVGAEDAVLRHDITLSDLEADAEYHYRVISASEGGDVAISDDGVFTTEPAFVLVENVIVDCASPESFTVRWTTSRPADSRVEYGTTADYGLSTETDEALVTEHTVTVSGLEPLTDYHFCARSTDAYGYSACSGDNEIKTAPPELALFEVAVDDTTDVTAVISWGTSNPATSIVEYGLTQSYGWMAGRTDNKTQHAVSLTGLAPSTTYHFRVSGTDIYGQKTTSQDFVFETYDVGYDDYPTEPPEAPPAAPRELSAELCDGGVCLRWGENTEHDLAGYNVYRRVEGDGDWTFLIYIGKPSTTHTDVTAPDGAVCEYSVSAVDTYDSESERSNIVSVTPGISARARMWVFPNPVSDRATIRLAPPSSVDGATRGGWDYSIRVYDVAGREMGTISGSNASGATASADWDLTDRSGRLVPNGIYFCVASMPGGSAHSKLIVVR